MFAGLPIAHREWLPEGEARGTVVIAHGINEHGGRYGHVAQRLVRDGWMVGAPDHRGHGLSGGRRAAVERFDDWITDLDSYIRDVLTAAPRPLFLVGHSLGGLIATVYALRHQDALDGLVLSSPSVMPPAEMSPATMRAGRFLSRWAVQPTGGRAAPRRREPRPGRGRGVPSPTRSSTSARCAPAPAPRSSARSTRCSATSRSCACRCSAVQGTVDLLVDPGAARWVDEHVGSSDHTLHIYDGLYHEVFNEPERDAVLDDVARWLDAHATVGAGAGEAALRRRRSLAAPAAASRAAGASTR